METLKTINFVIAVIFFVCYTYQFLYIPVPWLRKARPHGPAPRPGQGQPVRRSDLCPERAAGHRRPDRQPSGADI